MINSKGKRSGQIELPCQAWSREWYFLQMPGRVKRFVLGFLWLCLTNKWALPFVHRFLLVLGPPGVGKSSLVRAASSILASMLKEQGAENVFVVEAQLEELSSRWHGETGKNIAAFVDGARQLGKGRNKVVLIIDDADGVLRDRKTLDNDSNPMDAHQGVVTALRELDALRSEPNVVTVVISNYGGALDGALRDRADVTVRIPLPNTEIRSRILERVISSVNRAWSCNLPGRNDPAFDELVLRTQGFSGRRLVKLPIPARLLSGAWDDASSVSVEHFFEGIEFLKSDLVDDRSIPDPYGWEKVLKGESRGNGHAG